MQASCAGDNFPTSPEYSSFLCRVEMGGTRVQFGAIASSVFLSSFNVRVVDNER